LLWASDSSSLYPCLIGQLAEIIHEETSIRNMKESSFTRTPEEVLSQSSVVTRCILFTIQEVGVMLILDTTTGRWFLVLN